jgi:hypothetical protein
MLSFGPQNFFLALGYKRHAAWFAVRALVAQSLVGGFLDNCGNNERTM